MLGRIKINLAGGNTPTTTTSVWETSTTTVSACELSSDTTTTSTELLTDETDQNWLKNAVFYAAITSTVWLICLVLSKYRPRFTNCMEKWTKMATEARQSKDRDNRSDAEIKTDGSKNEGRSKNEEEITEVKEKKKKKRDTWMPGPDWARLNRQWRERKREEKIQEEV